MSKIEEVVIVNPYGITDQAGKITITSATSLRLKNCILRTGSYIFQMWIRSENEILPGNPVQININEDISSYDVTTDWSQLVIQGRIDAIYQDFIDISFPVGNFYVYAAQFEFGDKPSDWKPSVRENESMIKQTAQMISLMVESDDGKSEIILTDNMIQAITKQFVIKSPDGTRTVISGGKVSTDLVQSNDYEYTDGIYSNKGTMFGLDDTGFIRSKNFAVTEDGNAYLKGNVTASSGYIGDEIRGFQIGNKAISNGKTMLLDGSEGIYLGTDGISLGVNGKISFLPTGEGTIGGFHIGDIALYNSKPTLQSNSNGVYVGTDGISLGVGDTSLLLPNGSVKFVKGLIGGWDISSNGIYKNLTQVCNISNYNASTHNNFTGTFIGNNSYSSFNAKSTTYTSMNNGNVSGTLANNTIIQDGKIKLYESRYSSQDSVWNPEIGRYLSKVEITGKEIRISENESAGYNDSGWEDYVRINAYCGFFPNINVSNGKINLESDGIVYCSGIRCGLDELTVNSNIRAKNITCTDVTASGWAYVGQVHFNQNSSGNYISIGNYNNAWNNYYYAPGYHAFYCNGNGVAYIQSNGIKMNNYDIMFNIGHGIKYGEGEWILRPYKSGDYNVTALGNGDRRTVLYGSQVKLNSSTGTTVTSDRRLKKDFRDFDERYEKFFMNLKPQIYRMAYEKNAEEYKRTNGFVAQDVERALINADINPEELDLISHDTADKEFLDEMFNGHPPDIQKQYSLNYNNFISLNTHMIQKTRTEMSYQSGRLDMQQAIINDLQTRLWQAEKEIEQLKQAVK